MLLVVCFSLLVCLVEFWVLCLSLKKKKRGVEMERIDLAFSGS